MRASSSAASSRRNRSSIPSHSTTALTWSARLRQNRAKCSAPGWKLARRSTHESRGTIQRIWSGSAPCWSSHTHASIPVLPAPTTVKWSNRAATAGSRPTGTQVTSSATAYDGGVVAGTCILECVASTKRPHSTRRRAPDNSDVTTPSSSTSLDGQERDPPRRQEPVPHHGVEMRHDLMTRRQFVEPGVEPCLIDRPCAERPRAHPVVAGGLVQPHERVGLVPVATRSIMPIDDHHRRVGVAEQLIREGHPNGAGPLDQVVGLDHCTIGLPHGPSLGHTATDADQHPRASRTRYSLIVPNRSPSIALSPAPTHRYPHVCDIGARGDHVATHARGRVSPKYAERRA